MARSLFIVGYGTPSEVVDGVFRDTIAERAFDGKVLDAIKSNEESDKVNDDIRLRNRISILADAFLLENFSLIKYVIWNGAYWRVETAQVQRPRIILTFGGVYDGPKSATTP